MMSVNILSEKLTKLEEKLIRTYDNKFATFQSEMLMVVENRTNSERFQQEVSFVNLKLLIYRSVQSLLCKI